MPVRHGDPAALAARSTTIAACHLGRSGRLVEEDQAIRIEIGLTLEPVFARGLHIRPLLLGRVDSPFLRVMRCRAKKRDRLLVLARTPRSESL